MYSSCILLTLTFLFPITLSSLAPVDCPTPEELNHCFCYAKSGNIKCINDAGPPKLIDPKTFTTITFQNTKLVELKNDLFGSAKFVAAIIENNTELKSIGGLLFKNSETKSITIRNNPLLESTSIFDCIKNSIKTTTLDIENNKPIKEIKNTHFQSLTNLENLFLQNNGIESIGGDAFKNLKFLQMVRLDHNKITTLSTSSLEVSSQMVTFNLNYNEQLTADCFEENVFRADPQKTIKLFLENTHLNELPQTKFENLVNNGRNILYLGGNSFDCLCQRYEQNIAWILENKNILDLKNRLIHMRCAGQGKEIFELAYEDICGNPSAPTEPHSLTEPITTLSTKPETGPTIKEQTIREDPTTVSNVQTDDLKIPTELTVKTEPITDPQTPTEETVHKEPVTTKLGDNL